MMRILIKYSEKRTTKLQAEVDKIEKDIELLNLKDVTKKNYEIMDKILEDYQLYLRDKKLRKIKRDGIDYKEGRIYTFARKYDTLRSSSTNKRICSEMMETDSASSSSMCSLDSSRANEVLTPAIPSRNQSPFLV
ncbi:hypothetical protein NDU88_005079 [Pleurodeles waltl]|uniref:Uncharacterized protein n=1 Tax=Pleurodeles waltl TaxID=8319 RepID=A0AAV7NP75_PLEWA|nr:hypothetical protein NDU88_005079 [Pleurodeles waltl]